MGRLKAGESLYKPRPLPKAARFKSDADANPKTKTPSPSPPSRTRTRFRKLTNMYKRKRQTQKEEDEDEDEEEGGDDDVIITRSTEEGMEEETNCDNNNDDDDVVVVTVAAEPTTGDVSGEDTGPLSLLRKFPTNSSANSNNLNQLDPATREHYAKTAESLKKLLVSELSSWSEDLETIVASANRVFETLSWLQPDCAEFYEAVRALLSRRAQLSSVETELRTHQNEESSVVSSRSKEALEALARSDAEYKKAEERVGCLRNRVSELRVELQKLEDELKREEVMLVDRKREWNQCLESHSAIEKEEKELAEQMEEKRETIGRIKRLRDEAEAGVQSSIKALSSLC